MSLRASIVVPTRANPELLAGCVASLLADESRVERELVVVDNEPSTATAAIVEELAMSAPFPVRLVAEPALGSSHARNAGVAASGGDLILFVDDDVVVDKGWADALVAPFADEAVGMVAGRILPLWPETPPSWLDGPHRERLTLTDYGDGDRVLTPAEQPVTANLAVRRALLPERPFPPQLGNHGTRSFGQEDFRLAALARRSHEIRYAAGAVARHRIQRERMTLDWLRGTFFDMGIGLALDELDAGVEKPGLTRRAVRTVRVCRDFALRRRANERRGRDGDGTWEELYSCMWAGKHVEQLLGRFPRVRDLVRAALV